MSIAVQTLATDLTERQFQTISTMVKDLCGINLHQGKRELVKARLNKRLRELGMEDFSQYIDYVASDAGSCELLSMLDALSTNLTSFFRQNEHFKLLADRAVPQWMARREQRRIRIWSAGCSSGEEPYSLAIVLKEALGDLGTWDARILATDLSRRVLKIAANGVYNAQRVREVGAKRISQHFNQIGHGPKAQFQVKDPLRQIVSFARLNLMESWPMRGPFDAIFCRNVMIYFDKPTQAQLVDRFWQLLAPGGLLFIGHSESLTGVRHKFSYVQPTVYGKH